MFNFDIIEKQISKRLQVFFTHQATEANIDASKMQLIIRSNEREVISRIFENGKYIKQLELKAIAESFGKEYDHSKVHDVHEYLIKTAKASDMELAELSIVLCESKGRIAAFAYKGQKCHHKIPSMELLTIFYISR